VGSFHVFGEHEGIAHRSVHAGHDPSANKVPVREGKSGFPFAWAGRQDLGQIDPNLTFDQLPQLDSKLNLPEGYKFEVKTLTQDLTIDLRKAPDNTAHIVRDELHDVYEGCGFDHACNYTP
jgi:hypothetical protein